MQEGLEGDRGSDRVQWWRLLKKVHTRNCSFKEKFFFHSASKMANCIIADIANYLMLLLANS